MKKKLLSLLVACFLPVTLLAGSGDVNGNGIVDITDINVIISHIMGEQPDNFNFDEADVNGDGDVNIMDVVKLIQSQTEKKDLTSKLHLEITMPQAGDYKAVILETDGRLNTQTESAIQVLTLDGVQLSDDNLVLDVCLEMQPVDLTAHSLKVRVYDAEGNVFPVNEDLGKRDFTAGSTFKFSLTADAAECSGLPLVFVNNVDRAPIVSKEEWQDGSSFAIVYSDGSVLDAPGKIKGRGNNTWAQPKKPYTVKFSEKQEPFGFPKNKSWVLLADYFDHSLLRTAFMSSVSRAAGIEWTINYQHVNLYLNGEYHGVYLFTDKVEESSNRIKVQKDGFIIEDDAYYEHEKVNFVSSMGNGFSFKYPDDDKDIVKGDENYLFIKNYVNQAEAAMKLLEKDPNNTEYQTYIDIPSFAKFHIACASMLLFDPNRYYVLPSRQSKLKMMPIWDSEWSLGLRPKAWGKTTWSLVSDTSVDRAFYFRNLMESPAFKEAVKQEWEKFKSNVHLVKDEIEAVRQRISTAQAANFKIWPPKSNYYNISFDTWDEEVEYILQFFDERLEWLEGHYDSQK